jgi:Response regulator containing CheY-like receiver, AAA-type ATPase, and DNA-binding domains
MLSSNNGNAPLCILVVEDQDGKYNDILGAISDSDIQSPLLERAKNVVDAEDSIISRTWDLLVLDISMDISPGSLGPLRGGHANLGGLDIIEQMYLLDVSIPTIIITGFDYFQTFDDGQEQAEMLNLEDIEKKARERIKDNLLGCIRYGGPYWRSSFIKCINHVRIS